MVQQGRECFYDGYSYNLNFNGNACNLREGIEQDRWLPAFEILGEQLYSPKHLSISSRMQSVELGARIAGSAALVNTGSRHRLHR